MSLAEQKNFLSMDIILKIAQEQIINMKCHYNDGPNQQTKQVC